MSKTDSERGKHAKHAASSNADSTNQSQPQTPADSSDVPPLSSEAIDQYSTAVISEEPLSGGYSSDGYSYVDDSVNSNVAMPMTPIEFDDPMKSKKSSPKNTKKIVGIVVGIIAAVYLIGVAVFSNWFYPGTTIGKIDASMKSSAEVEEELDEAVSNYSIVVTGPSGFSYQASAKDTGATIDSSAVTKAVHADLSAWAWPVLVFQGNHDETDQLVMTYSESELDQSIRSAVNTYNTTAKDPVNATITYDSTSKSFKVKAEEAGTKLDVDAVVKAIDESIAAMDSQLTLGSEVLVQPTIVSTDSRLSTAITQANQMIKANITLTLGGKEVAVVDGDTLQSMVTIDDQVQATMDEEKFSEWIDQFVLSFDTVGTTRTYTRADGAVITVSGGVYGWEIDSDALLEELTQAISAGSTTTIAIPCIQEAEVYNGQGQRDWGTSYIDVDITEQYVRYYGSDGSIIWESACITGIPDGTHDTVEGVWYINNKESPSTLIGYENGKKLYETVVTYWMPFEGNGIGFHDASWQPDFGGTMYMEGYGSHGCVNLPVSAAAELYSIVEIGTPVVVHA